MKANGRPPPQATPHQRAELVNGLREALSVFPAPTAISMAAQLVSDLAIGIGLDREAFVDLMGQSFDRCSVVVKPRIVMPDAPEIVRPAGKA